MIPRIHLTPCFQWLPRRVYSSRRVFPQVVLFTLYPKTARNSRKSSIICFTPYVYLHHSSTMSKRMSLATHYTMPSKKVSSDNQAEAESLPTTLPKTAVPPADFLKLVEIHPDIPVRTLLEPFLDYEAVLRAYFAQNPDHEFVRDNHVNLISLFEDSNESRLKIHARNFASESNEEREKYIMPLEEKERKPTGVSALVSTFKDFKTQFNVFTEGSLNSLDWSNIIVAGSAVLTPLLEVPEEHRETKRGLRKYYHEIFAPASDIDLFLYGLDDPEEAIKKIEQIENTIKDNLLWEVTTIRTRNTVTFVSQYPNRHVQIVLRLYKSVSQILTGFDVNCSSFAFDGTKVLTNPRAVAACMTQCNDIDLTRRSPSYENRLAKYASRGFEVYCPFLDRSQINPSIFERSFTRTVGLARLLVLEKFPKPEDRDNYQEQRREEMGRPPSGKARYYKLSKDLKENVTNEIAEWDFEDVSGYQKFSIPYGEGYYAKKIEKLFFKKDLLLNAEWNPTNKPPHRNVNLHRHPVFFGNVKDVVEDCCGFCPKPLTEEEQEVAKEENEIYVSGKLTFLKDDPGRQEIGSFYPLGPEDYTEMAYVSSSMLLMEAIVNNDVDYVKRWAEDKSTDVNVRDFCGRTPLHLAIISTSTEMEIVQTLIDNGARLVARLQDGRTALHLAAARGRGDMLAALLKKSAQNEQERDEREECKKAQKKAVKISNDGDSNDDDVKMMDVEASVKTETEDSQGSATEPKSEASDESYVMSVNGKDSARAPTQTTAGFVKVEGQDSAQAEENAFDEEEEDDDIYDINITDWDYALSPLHHAIVSGHEKIVEDLVSEFGADVSLPVKIFKTNWRGVKSPGNAILNLVLPLVLTREKRIAMTRALLKVGANSAQANSFTRTTALHYLVMEKEKEVLEVIFELDGPNAFDAINRAVNTNKSGYWSYRAEIATPLTTALTISSDLATFFLDKGAHAQITLDDFVRSLSVSDRRKISADEIRQRFHGSVQHPIDIAIAYQYSAEFIQRLLASGADPSSLTFDTRNAGYRQTALPLEGKTILDKLRDRIKICREALEDLEKQSEQVSDPKLREVFDPVVLLQFPKGSYPRYVAEIYFDEENQKRVEHNEQVRNKPQQTVGEFLGSGSQSVPQLVDRLKSYREENGNTGAANKAKTKIAEQIEKTLQQHLEKEKILVAAGAQTYHERYPEKLQELKEREEQKLQSRGDFPRYGFVSHAHSQTKPKEQKDDIFDVNFHFKAPYLGEGSEKNKIKNGYMRLFEAVWRGRPEDLEVVKELTSGPSGDGEGRLPALQISVDSNYGFNALYIALYRSNYEMAELVHSIVEEQYEDPQSEIEKRYRVDEDDSDLESDDFQVNFTIESGEEQSTSLKCNVSPMNLLFSRMSVEHLIKLEEVNLLESASVYPRTQWTILSYAIYKNDFKLVEFILNLADISKETGASELVGSHADFTVYWTSHEHARLAIKLGRTELLEYLMSRVSFGIPYEELEEKDEEVQNAKPQYYQGLSVNGKKRKDWTTNSYPAFGEDSKKYQKPMQVAVYYANLDSIKWLESDRPMACLQQFLEKNADTKHAKLLKNQGKKLEKIFRKWLGLETTLLPHLAIKSRGLDEKHMEVFQYLLSRPGAVEARNDLGMTPLLYAAHVSHPEALSELSKPQYHVDFNVRDTSGRNILHLGLVPQGSSSEDMDYLRKFLDLVPEDIRKKAFTQRMLRTTQTPLAYWLEPQISRRGLVFMPAFRMFLEYSGGAELGIPNSEGNYLIHSVLQRGHVEVAQLILEYKPELIHEENANGRTPLEMATSQQLLFIRTGVKDSPNAVSLPDKPVSESGVDKDMGKEEIKNKKEEKKAGEQDKWSRSRTGDAFQLAKEAAERVPGKRKLVSLTEANALAERIRRGDHKQVQPPFQGGDILALW